jgi:putative methionine-R-sulfoxide reductase with GAF domain
MPESTLAIEAPETLAERVFDLSMDLASAPEEDAYGMALDLLLEFVQAEAGSVARGTLNDPNLKFVAATGPVADEIIGREVGFGEGLVGMCFDVRSTIVVDEVDQDTRHLDQFDAETGFSTVAALCVPVFDETEGLIYGVIQLLNPPGRGFTMQDKEAAELIAQTLSTALTRRGA